MSTSYRHVLQQSGVLDTCEEQAAQVLGVATSWLAPLCFLQINMCAFMTGLVLLSHLPAEQREDVLIAQLQAQEVHYIWEGHPVDPPVGQPHEDSAMPEDAHSFMQTSSSSDSTSQSSQSSYDTSSSKTVDSQPRHADWRLTAVFAQDTRVIDLDLPYARWSRTLSARCQCVSLCRHWICSSRASSTSWSCSWCPWMSSGAAGHRDAPLSDLLLLACRRWVPRYQWWSRSSHWKTTRMDPKETQYPFLHPFFGLRGPLLFPHRSLSSCRQQPSSWSLGWSHHLPATWRLCPSARSLRDGWGWQKCLGDSATLLQLPSFPPGPAESLCLPSFRACSSGCTDRLIDEPFLQRDGVMNLFFDDEPPVPEPVLHDEPVAIQELHLHCWHTWLLLIPLPIRMTSLWKSILGSRTCPDISAVMHLDQWGWDRTSQLGPVTWLTLGWIALTHYGLCIFSWSNVDHLWLLQRDRPPHLILVQRTPDDGAANLFSIFKVDDVIEPLRHIARFAPLRVAKPQIIGFAGISDLFVILNNPHSNVRFGTESLNFVTTLSLHNRNGFGFLAIIQDTQYQSRMHFGWDDETDEDSLLQISRRDGARLTRGTVPQAHGPRPKTSLSEAIPLELPQSSPPCTDTCIVYLQAVPIKGLPPFLEVPSGHDNEIIAATLLQFGLYCRAFRFGGHDVYLCRPHDWSPDPSLMHYMYCTEEGRDPSATFHSQEFRCRARALRTWAMGQPQTAICLAREEGALLLSAGFCSHGASSYCTGLQPFLRGPASCRSCSAQWSTTTRKTDLVGPSHTETSQFSQRSFWTMFSSHRCQRVDRLARWRPRCGSWGCPHNQEHCLTLPATMAIHQGPQATWFSPDESTWMSHWLCGSSLRPTWRLYTILWLWKLLISAPWGWITCQLQPNLPGMKRLWKQLGLLAEQSPLLMTGMDWLFIAFHLLFFIYMFNHGARTLRVMWRITIVRFCLQCMQTLHPPPPSRAKKPYVTEEIWSLWTQKLEAAKQLQATKRRRKLDSLYLVFALGFQEALIKIARNSLGSTRPLCAAMSYTALRQSPHHSAIYAISTSN